MACSLKPSLSKEDFVGPAGDEVTLKLKGPAESGAEFVHLRYDKAAIYDSATEGLTRWRDLQVAAQLDRRLGRVPSLGNAVFTLALYYQWMRDDAAVKFGDTAAATLPGLTLADGSETVLGTAGHIVVFQGKLAVPLNDVVKVPFSVTYANRRELIPEKQTWRGQVGLSIDLDGLFK